MAIQVNAPPEKKSSLGTLTTLGGGIIGGIYGGPAGASTGASIGGTIGGLASGGKDQYNPVDTRMQKINDDPETTLVSGQSAAKNLGLDAEYSDYLQQALMRSRKTNTNPPPTGQV